MGTPSSSRESAEPDAPESFRWIGYIRLDRSDSPSLWRAVIFDDRGNGVTLSGCTMMDEFVPLWVAPAIDFLVEGGLLPSGCMLRKVDPGLLIDKGFKAYSEDRAEKYLQP